jgi:hypothetical protein
MVNIHLCQPDATKSCAACCGIYNYVENTRDELEQRFLYRTRLFERVREGTLAMEEYQGIFRHGKTPSGSIHHIYLRVRGFLMKPAGGKAACFIRWVTTGETSA